jgi:predicted lipoprotein with Yx(FWY)xxD motif
MSANDQSQEVLPPIPVRRRRSRLGTASLAALLAAGTTMAIAGVSISDAASATLQKITVKPYAGILTSAKHHSLYLLSNERGAKIHCRTSCLNIWPPFLVKTSVKSVSVGGGVAGKTGFVKRSATMKQVTFNGYPIYFFTGDSRPNQVNGQGIVADGGTWYLVRAGATSPSTTKVTGASTTTTTTTTTGYTTPGY